VPHSLFPGLQLALLLFGLVTTADIAPKPAPQLVTVPAVSARFGAGTLYAEVLNRDPHPFTSSNRCTNAHESCHGINARLRTQANAKYGKGNGVYFPGGTGATFPEPKLRKSSVAAFVPQSLRGYRFPLYLLQSHDWEDQPTYLLDEWSAYVVGAHVAVEDHQNGHRVERSDWLSGPVEFSFYALALARAVEHYDPDYWRSHPQFKEVIRHELALARKVYLEGQAYRDLARQGDQDKLIKRFRTAPDCAALRKFAADHFDAAWLTD
jgi:hypothetical protein